MAIQLHLYQIWYNENTKPSKESGLLSFDCRNTPETLKRETAHLIRFYDEIVAYAHDDDYFALLSPRFTEKTGLSITQVKDFVSAYPDHDIFLFNPFPMHVYLYMNVWDSGEYSHKGIKELTQHLFDKANIDFNVYDHNRNTIYSTVYSNYWVASKPFLDDFIKFIKLLDSTIDKMPEQEKEKFFSDTEYYTKVSFYPFIFERLISTFLLMHKKYKSKPYIYDDKAIDSKKLKRIDSFFYTEGYRSAYDKWEELNKDDLERLSKAHLVIKNFLRPNTTIFPFIFLNRLSNSIIKRINVYKYNSQLEDLNTVLEKEL